jgi:thiamine biosynthesis lipoprotein
VSLEWAHNIGALGRSALAVVGSLSPVAVHAVYHGCMPAKALLVVTLCFLASCSREPQELVLSGPTMGTTYTVKIVGTPSTLDTKAIRAVLDEVLANIDVEMSIYRDDSAISRFNASTTTEWIDVPLGLARVVAASHAISERSNGVFDITISPLIQAWGFGPNGEPQSLPTEAEIAALRDRMGYGRLEVRLDPASLRKQHPLLTIDVNGVAPGYAVDVLAARFTALGLKSFMIDLGGEVLARGRNARGQLWRIAVERPIDGDPQPFKVIELDNESVTTSGEYRHYFARNGERYSHTLDPRTGRPIRSRGSVAIVGSSSLEIDAWATALNVLGPEEGLKFADREDLAAMYVVVEEEGELEARMSRRFEDRVRLAKMKR